MGEAETRQENYTRVPDLIIWNKAIESFGVEKVMELVARTGDNDAYRVYSTLQRENQTEEIPK